MSARTLLLTRVGSAWYSACTRSGPPPAFEAVITLVSRSSPEACFSTVTWMSGWALFHSATTLSMAGAQAQYVRWTGPEPASWPLAFGRSDPEPDESEPLPPQPATRAVSIEVATTPRA